MFKSKNRPEILSLNDSKKSRLTWRAVTLILFTPMTAILVAAPIYYRSIKKTKSQTATLEQHYKDVMKLDPQNT